MSAAKLVTIYGGSGFLGRQIARVMAAQGWRIRVAVRRPNESGVVRTYGAPGQIEPVREYQLSGLPHLDPERYEIALAAGDPAFGQPGVKQGVVGPGVGQAHLPVSGRQMHPGAVVEIKTDAVRGFPHGNGGRRNKSRGVGHDDLPADAFSV